MQVFISYSPDTGALAKKVGKALERAGLSVWNSDQEILPGDNWFLKVGQALEASEAMVVLLTPDGLDSPTVLQEIEYALSRKSFSKRLIPVFVSSDERIPYEKLPWILSHLDVIRLPAHGKQEEGINQITQALQAVA